MSPKMPRYEKTLFDPREVKNHWKEFRPKMYRDLEKSGKLDQFVQKAIQLTQEGPGAPARPGPSRPPGLAPGEGELDVSPERGGGTGAGHES